MMHLHKAQELSLGYSSATGLYEDFHKALGGINCPDPYMNLAKAPKVSIPPDYLQAAPRNQLDRKGELQTVRSLWYQPEFNF